MRPPWLMTFMIIIIIIGNLWWSLQFQQFFRCFLPLFFFFLLTMVSAFLSDFVIHLLLLCISYI